VEKKQVITGVGGVLAGIIASSCCWLPLLLLAVGASATAVGAFTNTIETFRPLFAVVAIGFLGAAWYFTYFRRPARASATGEACCAIEPKNVAPSSKEACCAVEPGKDGKNSTCSCCHENGKRVPASTVRALVRGDLRDQVREGDYVLCLNPGCAQVYSGPDGTRPFAKSDLAVRVGYKEREGPHLVCYCFNHSVEEIETQLRGSGKTTVPESIKAEIQAGRCACEVKNPQGTCCLGNVNRATKEAEARIAGRSTASVGAPAFQCAPPPAIGETHEDCCRLPRGPGAPSKVVGGLQRLNKVIIPLVTVLILGMVFFPHQIFSFLARPEPASPTPSAPAILDTDLKSIVLSVPGMT
jgi:hypothetical protein